MRTGQPTDLPRVRPPLTKKQARILAFIQAQQESGLAPTMREICQHFGFKSPNAATDHVKALRRKGYLANNPAGKARNFHIIERNHRKQIIKIPIYGTIPAGFSTEKIQEKDRSIPIEPIVFGVRNATFTYGLEVRGESMIGRHILPGDIAIIQRNRDPKPGDVVAALIDNESTLKTFFVDKNGKAMLKAENPKFPDLEPARELTIQGVMVGLIRREK
jgi:repressor LexA